MKLAQQLIKDGMDPDKVANMPIHFFIELVESKTEEKEQARSFKDIF